MPSKKYYWKNREKYRQDFLKRRKKIKRFFRKYMRDKFCVKCGTNKRLHNHHKDKDDPRRRDKKLGIYYLVNSAYSIKTILEELALTEVLCVNCHAQTTCKTRLYTKKKIEIKVVSR